MKVRLMFMIGAIVAMVACLAASTSVHAQTSTQKSQGREFYGYAYGYDPETDTYSFSYAVASEGKTHVPGGGQDRSAFGEMYYSSYNLATGESCYAEGPLTERTIAKNLASASASGIMTLTCLSYDPETDTLLTTTRDAVMAVRLEAIAPAVKTAYSDISREAGQFNIRYTFAGSQREASPVFSVDDVDVWAPDIFGQIEEGRSSAKVTVIR